VAETVLASAAPGDGARTRIDRKLTASLGLAQLGSYLVWGSAPAVLLAVQLEDVDPSHKEANLALVIAVGALVSMVGQPIWGLASDRTRSRFGGRAPYLLAGAVVGALALLATALAETVLWIAVFWCIAQAAVTGGNGVLVAVLPDRVPAAVRATVSSVMAFGALAGTLGGQVVASALVPYGRLLPYAVVAAVLVAVFVVFVMVNPDTSSLGARIPPLSLRALIGLVWVSPRRHPDFAFAFLGRMFLTLGYHTVAAYQLYILQDYAQLGRAAVLRTVPLAVLIGLAAMALSLLVCGWLSDRVGRRKPFVFASTLLIGVGLVVPLLSPSVTGFLIYVAVAGLGFGCLLGVDIALMSQVLPAGDGAAKNLGVAGIAAHLPQVVAPVLAGLIVVGLGGYRPLFVFALGFCVLGALCVVPIRSVR
jgi:MFS family permease